MSVQIGALIQELNEVLADTGVDVSCHDSLVTKLTPANLAVFQFLPTEVRQQLLLDRDPHGNVQVRHVTDHALHPCSPMQILRSPELHSAGQRVCHRYGWW